MSEADLAPESTVGTDVDGLDPEAPLADAVEQRQLVQAGPDEPDAELPPTPPGLPLEAEPADLLEQARAVGDGDEDYR